MSVDFSYKLLCFHLQCLLDLICFFNDRKTLFWPNESSSFYFQLFLSKYDDLWLQKDENDND